MTRYLITKENGSKRFDNMTNHQIMEAILNDDYIGSYFNYKNTFTPDYDFEEIESETDRETIEIFLENYEEIGAETDRDAIEFFLENYKTTVSIGSETSFQSYYLDKVIYEDGEEIYRDGIASSIFDKDTISMVLHYFAKIEDDFETYKKMILSKKIAQYDGIEEMLKSEWDFVEWKNK